MVTQRLTRIIQAVAVILLWSGLALPGLAQSPVTAQVDRTRLSADEALTLTITVTGDFLNIPQPDLGQLTDFQVLGSSSSTQISIINGELTTQGNFVFYLQPVRTGSLVIPPVGVEVDGQVYQTSPINIEVVGGSGPVTPPTGELPQSSPAGRDFFVEAEVDNTTPYLGQQIVYVFRLYRSAQFGHQQPDYQPPAFTDFWGQQVLSQPTYNDTLDGQDYLVSEIRTGLFPAKVGRLTIDPSKLVLHTGFLQPDVVLETEPVTVQVQSLPEGAPDNFNGAVGQFEISARLSESTGQVDEPLTLIVSISGQGNIEVLSEPSLDELPNWRIFDSQATTQTEVRSDIIYGTRHFERLIVPTRSGEYTIPALSFSYYDPQAGHYQTISTEPIPVTVQPGEGDPRPVVVGVDKQPVAIVGGDIRHIKPVPPTLKSSTDASLLDSLFYWTCWVWPAVVVGGVWFWRRQQQRLIADSAYARRQYARRVAQKILNEAEQAEQDRYGAAHRALLGYLSDKLNQPTVGLTTGELLSLLKKHHLEPALLERVRDTLDLIDVGRFAPVAEADKQSIVADTRQLINDLEQAFKEQS